MKKLLVTGSEGSIGQFIVSQLYSSYSDVQVIRVGRTQTKTQDDKSIYLLGDLTDPDFCKEIFAKHDIKQVIFCAAHWNGINQDPLIFTNNLMSISSLLHNLSDTVEKFVFISSSAVYGNGSTSDTTQISSMPSSTYGDAKLMGEVLVKACAKLKKFSYTIYRPFHVVSPLEEFNRGSSHVCTDFCHRMIANKEVIDIESLSDENTIGFFWVEDFAKLVVANLNKAAANNESFNIGTPEEHSIAELALEIKTQACDFALIDKCSQNIKLKPISSTAPNKFEKLKMLNPEFQPTSFKNCVNKFLTMKYLEKKNETT